MKEFSLIGYEYGKTSCEHCGRAIRNIAILKNNVTGDIQKVGLTCVQKIMNLNDNFYKAMSREIKKFHKDIEFYSKSLDIETNLINLVEVQKGYNKNHYCYKTYDQVFENAIDKVGFALARMIIECEKMNKLSKSGFIDISIKESLKIQRLEYLKKFDSEFNGKLKSCYYMKDIKTILNENKDLKDLYEKYKF